MKRHTFRTIVIFLFIVLSYSAGAQFTPEELAEKPRCEEFLKAADIVQSEEIGEGVTKPFRLYLKMGDMKATGIWKNPKGMKGGYLEGWRYEIAAYEMDKLLDLNLIPPTVEKEFKGKKGSLQLWVESEYSLLDIMEQKISFPPEYRDHINKMKYITRAFDSLIANEDRTQQNILYTKDWRMILIDHSRSFRSSNKFTKQLMFGKNGIQGPKLMRCLPRAFVEKIKMLDFKSIKNAVGPYLKDKEIKAILARKKLLLNEISQMIKEQGEDKILY